MAMSEAQKLAFVHKMTHLGLSSVPSFPPNMPMVKEPQHFDTGGVTQPNAPGGFNLFNNAQGQVADITHGTNAGQLDTAYNGAQQGVGAATQLSGQLTPGVGQGVGSQDLLTKQLQAQTLGQGPNPAQAALNVNTGNNIRQAAALAASTRGAGANPGLIASNAANTGANTLQQSAGQAAVLQGQQQLAAQNELANIAGQQVGQGTGAVQLQNQVQQNEQNILQGANTATNNQLVSQQENLNNVAAGVGSDNSKSSQNILGGIGQALSSIGGAVGLFAKGGEVPPHYKAMVDHYHVHLAPGGTVWQNSSPQETSSINAGAPVTSKVDATSLSDSVKSKLKDGGKVPGKPKVNRDAYSNDTVDAKLTPGEVVIDLNTLKDKGKLGKMARFVAQEIERKKMGRAV